MKILDKLKRSGGLGDALSLSFTFLIWCFIMGINIGISSEETVWVTIDGFMGGIFFTVALRSWFAYIKNIVRRRGVHKLS